MPRHTALRSFRSQKNERARTLKREVVRIQSSTFSSFERVRSRWAPLSNNNSCSVAMHFILFETYIWLYYVLRPVYNLSSFSLVNGRRLYDIWLRCFLLKRLWIFIIIFLEQTYSDFCK